MERQNSSPLQNQRVFCEPIAWGLPVSQGKHFWKHAMANVEEREHIPVVSRDHLALECGIPRVLQEVRVLPAPVEKFWVSLNVDLQLQTLSQSNLLAGGLHWGQEYITSLCRMEESMTISRYVQRPETSLYQLHKWTIIGKGSWETAGGNEALHRLRCQRSTFKLLLCHGSLDYTLPEEG